MTSSNSHSTPEEKRLFDLVADGDASAFRQLFDTFSKKFYGVVFKMTGSHYLAEEVVQEAFIRVWDKRDKFKGLDNPGGYLHTVFYNCVSERFRKEAAARLAEGKLLEMPYQDELTNEERLMLEERYLALDNAVRRLAPQQAQVFYLIKQQGLSREQAARQLNLSPNTVRNHLAEATRMLRKMVQAAPLLLPWIVQWWKK